MYVECQFCAKKYTVERGPDSIALIHVNSLACVNSPIGFNGLFTPVQWDYSHTQYPMVFGMKGTI